MAIRFAGARVDNSSPISAWLCHSAPMCATNDNASEPLAEVSLVAALRHFGEHGLAAAERAGERAVLASLQRDQDACRHWLAVCRQFDRRLADRIHAKLGSFAA